MTLVPETQTPRQWLLYFLGDPPETDACIDWPYACNSRGYGHIQWGGSVQHVIRVVLTHLVGMPPEGAHAAHAPVVCHNAKCINPRHLRWSTPKENQADRVLDGTHDRGEASTNAKLTESKVLELVAMAASNPQQKVADHFGISRWQVRNILNGQCWGWLTGIEVTQ